MNIEVIAESILLEKEFGQIVNTLDSRHNEAAHPLLISGLADGARAVFYGALKSVRHPAAANLLKMLPTAAFNNMTVGVLLIVNHQFALPLGSAMMLSIGAALGFTLLTLMVGYLRSRLDHPSIPVAFRGLPILLISLGLLALGLMGFASSIALI